MRDETPNSDPRLTALLFGELDDDAQRELEATLAGDAALEAELLSLLDTSVLLEEALGGSASVDVPARDLPEQDRGGPASVVPLRAAPLARGETLRVWGAFAAAAALVLAVVVGINADGSPLADHSAPPAAGPTTAPESPEADRAEPEAPGFADMDAFEAPIAEPVPDPASVDPAAADAQLAELAEEPAEPESVEAASEEAAPEAEPSERRAARRSRRGVGSSAAASNAASLMSPRAFAPRADPAPGSTETQPPPTPADPPPRRVDEGAILDAFEK